MSQKNYYSGGNKCNIPECVKSHLLLYIEMEFLNLMSFDLAKPDESWVWLKVPQKGSVPDKREGHFMR